MFLKYTKPSLTPKQQAELLLRRGMLGDRDFIIEKLGGVSYYRLSGYWYPFRNSDDSFREGTRFDTVWRRYAFDRQLRLLVMDAIERIEVAVRTQLALHHSQLFGPFGYAEKPESLPDFKNNIDREKFIARISEEAIRSHEPFRRHFVDKYGDAHPHLPIWMLTEVMSMGSTLTLYKASPHKVKQLVANLFEMPAQVLESWLLCLNTVRNICAHHARLWNRELGIKPWIPLAKQYPEWHAPVAIPKNRIFSILTICRYCMRILAPQSQWAERLQAKLAEFPELPQRDMGFPENWRESPIWIPTGVSKHV